MASTPQTRGFEVNVMPQASLADPRYFNPFGSIGAGLSSGINMGGQLADIAYKRQQQQLDASLQPLRASLLAAQVSKAQQQSQVPDIVWGNSAVKDMSRLSPKAMVPVLDEQGEPVLDDNGEPMFQASPEAPDIEYGDEIRTTEGIKYLPGGKTEPVTKTETLKLARDREQEANAKESLIAQRESAAKVAEESLALRQELGRLRAESDAIKAKAEADKVRFLTSNPMLEHRSIERGGRKFIQYYPKGHPESVVEEVDAGVFSGNIFAPGAIINPVAPGAAAPASGEADLAAALSGKYGGAAPSPKTSPLTAPLPSGAPSSAPVRFSNPNITPQSTPAFASEAEAQAAFLRGEISLGDKISIAGQTGTWQ